MATSLLRGDEILVVSMREVAEIKRVLRSWEHWFGL